MFKLFLNLIAQTHSMSISPRDGGFVGKWDISVNLTSEQCPAYNRREGVKVF